MKKNRITVLLLSLAMVLTMSASVFAAGTRGDLDPSEGVANNGNTVVLTKEFNVPQGVAVPTDGFTFTAAPVTDSGEDYLVTSGHPAINFGTISFSDASRVSESDTKLVDTKSVDLGSLSYPKAGLYEWTITEDSTGGNEDITYASESYTLRVYVKNGENGTEVDMITVEPEGGEKIDASQPDDDPSDDADNDGEDGNDGNSFRFVNNYKTDEVTENPSDEGDTEKGAFELSKAVTGDYGDKTLKFKFVVNVTLPEVLPAGKTAADYASGTQTFGDDDGFVEIADGETFRIQTLPVGTTITVKEAASEHYTPSFEGKHTGATGTAEAFDGSAAENSELATATIVVGKTGAYVAYTNDFDDTSVTPTGIVINNLPYVLLIGIALGGIILFAKKRRYE